jgi:hypothetical protein
LGSTTAVNCRRFLSFFALLALAGCVSVPQEGGPVQKPKAEIKAGPDFPHQMAVLPMNNKAGDADGAMILRALVKHKLEECGYRVQTFDETDQIIRDRTSVGPEVPVQVALANQDPKILTAWLGVDGILHGELLVFNRAQLSIYTRREVKATFWRTDRENKTLWEGNQDSDSGTFGGGSVPLAGYLTGSGISPDVVDKLSRSPLANATINLVDDTFSTLPRLQ